MSLWVIISGSVLIALLAALVVVIGCVLRLSSRIDDFEELNNRGNADAICESAQTENVPKEQTVFETEPATKVPLQR
jgi:hypothetical protein